MEDIKIKREVKPTIQEDGFRPSETRTKGPEGDAPLEKKLYESLLRKQKLFKMLELEGYVNKKDAAPIGEQIDKALLDLEEIIKITGKNTIYEL